MRNLAIILISLFPFIGFSQFTENENIHPDSKIYHESGVEPFSEILEKKPIAKIVTTAATATVDHQSKNHFELDNDECRTTRVYDNSKVYFEIGKEIPSRKINKNQPVKVAANLTATTSDNQEFNLPVYNGDDYKSGFFNSNEQSVTPLKTIADDFITIRVYETSKVYYEIKVPAKSEKRLITIHHQHQ